MVKYNVSCLHGELCKVQDFIITDNHTHLPEGHASKSIHSTSRLISSRIMWAILINFDIGGNVTALNVCFILFLFFRYCLREMYQYIQAAQWIKVTDSQMIKNMCSHINQNFVPSSHHDGINMRTKWHLCMVSLDISILFYQYQWLSHWSVDMEGCIVDGYLYLRHDGDWLLLPWWLSGFIFKCYWSIPNVCYIFRPLFARFNGLTTEDSVHHVFTPSTYSMFSSLRIWGYWIKL